MCEPVGNLGNRERITTESTGLSREEFEKWAETKAPSLGLEECKFPCGRQGEFHYREYPTEKSWEAAQHFYAAASSLKQAPQEYEIMDTSSMKREPAEGKQAEPSQPEQDHIIWTLRQCLRFIRDESSSISEHDASDMEATVENLICRLAESTSQASKL